MSICLCIILSKWQNVLPYSASDWLVSSFSCFPCLVFVSPLVRQPFRCGPEHQLQRTAQLPDQLMDAFATLRSWSGLAKLANEHRDSTLHSAFLSLVLQTLHFSSMGSSVLSSNVFSLQGGEGIRVQPDVHWLFLLILLLPGDGRQSASSPHYRHTLTPAQWQHTVDTKRKGKKQNQKTRRISVCHQSAWFLYCFPVTSAEWVIHSTGHFWLNLDLVKFVKSNLEICFYCVFSLFTPHSQCSHSLTLTLFKVIEARVLITCHISPPRTTGSSVRTKRMGMYVAKLAAQTQQRLRMWRERRGDMSARVLTGQKN